MIVYPSDQEANNAANPQGTKYLHRTDRNSVPGALTEHVCRHRATTIKLSFFKKVKGSRYMPGVAQRVPGGLGSKISMTFGTWSWWGRQSHAPAAFTPRKCSWYSFSLGAESIPGLWYGRKEYVIEKSSDSTGNRFRDRPTSSAAP
jgi:hypothetical protein